VCLSGREEKTKWVTGVQIGTLLLGRYEEQIVISVVLLGFGPMTRQPL